MSRHRLFEPKIYKHQETIDELDEFMIAVKSSSLEPRDGLTEEQISKLKQSHPLPSISVMDKMHFKIREILSEDYELLIKR